MPSDAGMPEPKAVRGPSCFPTPLLNSALFVPGEDGTPKVYRPDAARADGLQVARDPDLDDIVRSDTPTELARLSDEELLAVSRLIPTLACGEESAVIVFAHESRRMSRKARDHLAAALLQIAREEEQHEVLLGILTDALPTPDDLDDIRGSSRTFFTKLGFTSGEPSDRLNLIGALDRCVCITLGSMLKRASLTKSPIFLQIVSRIRSDEARHVKICRGVMRDLGIGEDRQREADRAVRRMYVDLLEPIGDAFETVGVDPDLLFRDILRGTTA